MIPPAVLPLKFTIPTDGLKFSTNKIYAGVHWSKRKSVKDSVLSYAAVFCRPIRRIESYPVEIRYQFFFSSRPLDTLNTAALAKMFEDSLRSLGIIEDDDPKHVARSILEVTAISKPKGSQKIRAPGNEVNEAHKDHLILTIQSYESSTSTIATPTAHGSRPA